LHLKTFSILLVVGAVASFPVRADSLIDLIVGLGEHPDLDMAAFEEELSLAFTGLENIERYGAADLPNGVTDPFYWAISSNVSSNLTGFERLGLGVCNRLGLEGFDTVSLATDCWTPVEGKPSIFGTWPVPLKAFPEDAVARLDCTFHLEAEDSQAVDISAIAKEMEPNFVEVKITNGGEGGSIFNPPSQSVSASKGVEEGLQRVERISIKTDDVGIDVSFSVWLLNRNS